MSLLMSFLAVTILDTIAPGPTLALVLQTRADSGKTAAFATVLGVTLADVLWVILALIVIHSGAQLAHDWIDPIVKNVGAAFLIYLASKRILSCAVDIIARQNGDPPVKSALTASTAFRYGFMAHAVNPLSPAYYLGTFSLVISTLPLNYAIVGGAFPVLIDLLIFSLLALAWVNLPTFGFATTRLVRLFVGFFFVFLVGLAFSESHDKSNVLVTSWTAILMLVGFLAGALHEAIEQVGLRQKKPNKMLWRSLAVWSSWFSIAALVGALYTAIGGFKESTFSLPPEMEHRVRICFVIAAILAATLSFAKAIGELYDERVPAEGTPPTAPVQGWRTNPLRVGVAVIGLLTAAFLLLWVTGFNVVPQVKT